MTTHAELLATITESITAKIEAGAGKWEMPWATIAGAGARNAVTGVAYRGLNVLWLAMTSEEQGWDLPTWATYKQWASIGAQVRRGEKGTHLVKWVTVQDKARPDSEKARKLVPSTFTVFSSAQVDNYTPPATEERDTPDRIDAAEIFFATIGAVVQVGGDKACYRPGTDEIAIPDLVQFTDAPAYYSTLAHEHGHWTGHTSRLARDLSGRFGSDAYAVEELVAELTAAFVCGHLGLSQAPRPDHAAYIAGWLRVLRADTGAISVAATKAQAAYDYLLGAVGAVAETSEELLASA